MASADYTFWLGREAEAHRPMRVWADERGCMAEAVGRLKDVILTPNQVRKFYRMPPLPCDVRYK